MKQDQKKKEVSLLGLLIKTNPKQDLTIWAF
jgi:hypothetical protein